MLFCLSLNSLTCYPSRYPSPALSRGGAEFGSVTKEKRERYVFEEEDTKGKALERNIMGLKWL